MWAGFLERCFQIYRSVVLLFAVGFWTYPLVQWFREIGGRLGGLSALRFIGRRRLPDFKFLLSVRFLGRLGCFILCRERKWPDFQFSGCRGFFQAFGCIVVLGEEDDNLRTITLLASLFRFCLLAAERGRRFLGGTCPSGEGRKALLSCLCSRALADERGWFGAF